MILAVDTALRSTSVALVGTGGTWVSMTLSLERAHSGKLMPMVRELLKVSDLRPAAISAIAASEGPGSFTGLRIGVTAAKALAYGWKLPFYGISTLEALALGIQLQTPEAAAAVMIDARNRRVYGALYLLRIEHPEDPGETAFPPAVEVLIEPENLALDRFFDAVKTVLEERALKRKPLGFTGSAAVGYRTEILDPALEWAGNRFIVEGGEASLAERVGALAFQRQETAKRPVMTCTPRYLRRSSAERLPPDQGERGG